MKLAINVSPKKALSGCHAVPANAPLVYRKKNAAAQPGHSVPPYAASYKPEDAVKFAAALRASPNRRPLSDYFGTISPATYGDGVSYQRQLRDEWNG